MAKKVIEKEVSEVVEETAPVKVKGKIVEARLSNNDVHVLLDALIEKISKEKNLRTVKENIIDREISFNLDGVIQGLKAVKTRFDIFVTRR